MQKLYRVTIEVEMMVAADNEFQAVQVGRRYAADEISDDHCTTISVEHKAGEQLPDEWDETAIPFGSKDDKTLGAFLKEISNEG